MHPWIGLSDEVRLGLLTEWIAPELVDEVLTACGRGTAKPRPLSSRFMVYFVAGDPRGPPRMGPGLRLPPAPPEAGPGQGVAQPAARVREGADRDPKPTAGCIAPSLPVSGKPYPWHGARRLSVVARPTCRLGGLRAEVDVRQVPLRTGTQGRSAPRASARPG
ncbi:transposase domain-containing protein [Streptomyces atratus]|uniref:transposase domain-containing protein n=1 Tax=Streptomyces atratus TaxID=1893 RepID=UPI00339061D1